MTPEREYLLVAEFFYGSVEIGEATVDDDIIDQGLVLVRRLWDAGLAHRDIKPANLLVRDGELLVIDVAFVQARPSPWRQAIDLANMMLVLAVRTDAPRVYERATRLFTPDEIAEAFAATRGVASPTQLRMMMKRDGRDLVTQFRELAPPCRPVSLQRWSVKRVLLAGGVLIGGLLALSATFNLFVPAQLEGKRHAELRDGHRDGAHGAGRPGGHLRPVHGRAPRRMGARGRGHQAGRGQLLVGLRSRRRAEP